jgi:hypothetical protein
MDVPGGSDMEVTDGSDAGMLELYGRCKALTLTAGATLLLEQRPAPALREDALTLAQEAKAAAAGSGRRRAQLAGIHDAALALAALIEQDPADRAHVLDQAKQAQRQLRLRLGPVLAPQYAPCGTRPGVPEVHRG